MKKTLFEQINENPSKMGNELGIELKKLHSQTVDISNQAKNRLINFHDKCHKIIFEDKVSARIGAVQTTYIWQFIIQYIHRLENLPQPCLTLQSIDIKNDTEININKTEINDPACDIGAVLRYDIDKNQSFVESFKSAYGKLSDNFIEQAKFIDLYWWLQQINNMDRNHKQLESVIETMLSEFANLGAGNKDRFEYEVDTTALVQDRKK